MGGTWNGLAVKLIVFFFEKYSFLTVPISLISGLFFYEKNRVLYNKCITIFVYCGIINY